MRPARPGSRWWRGVIALRVWVRHLAPDARAERPWVYVADEWPRETMMFSWVRDSMRSVEPGFSGARVVILMAATPSSP